MPIAIGRNGQNIRLASEVTGYTIDAVKKSDYEGEKTEIYLDEIDGISPSQIEALSKLNISTGNDFLDAERKLLLSINGFGEKTIDRIAENILQKIDLLSSNENDVEDNTTDIQKESNEKELESLK